MVELSRLIGTMSPSRLDTAQQCLARFAFSYVDPGPRRFRADSAFGKTVDAAQAAAYRDKAEHGDTPDAERIVDLFAAEWDFDAGAVDDWQGYKAGELLDAGVAGLRLWRDRIAAHVTPKAVQADLRVRVTDPVDGTGFDLRGIVDVIGEARDRPVVADGKTSGRRYSASRFAKSFQPAAYTLLTGVPTFEFHVLTTTRQPETQVLRATVSDSDRRLFLTRAGMLRRQIAAAHKSGDWLPNRGGTLCSRRYCDHWERCEKAFGGTVPA